MALPSVMPCRLGINDPDRLCFDKGSEELKVEPYCGKSCLHGMMDL